MIDFRSLQGRQQFFTWQDKGSNVYEHFAITPLNAHLMVTGFPATKCEITQHLIDAAWRNGIEKVRLGQLTERELAQPLTLLERQQGWHIIADGSHRLIRLHELGKVTFWAWMVPEAIWGKFRLTNLPDDRGAKRPGFRNQF